MGEKKGPTMNFSCAKTGKAYMAAQEFQRKHHIRGPSSSASSSLLAALHRFPLAFSQHTTGTRCPVVYKLGFDPNVASEKPKILVKGKEIDPFKLTPAIVDHMATLGKGFSTDELLVEDYSAALQEMEIVDLVGLRPNTEDTKAEEVMAISQYYMKNPDNFVVAVLKCPISVGCMPDIALLNQAAEGTEWQSRATFIINHFNKESQDWPLDTVNTFFDSFRTKTTNLQTFFCILKPAPNFDPSKTTPHELALAYKSVLSVEKKWWDDYTAALQSEYPLDQCDPKNDKQIGLQRAIEAISHVWEDNFRLRVPTLRALQRRLIASRSWSLPRRTGAVSPIGCSTISAASSSLVQLKGTTDLDAPMSSLNGQRSFDQTDFGYTWDEEVELCRHLVPKHGGDLWKSRDELAKVLGEDSALLKNLNQRFVGVAALDRVLVVTKVIALGDSFWIPASEEKLQNLGRCSDSVGQFNTGLIIKEVALPLMKQAGLHLRTLFAQYATPLLDDLTYSDQYQCFQDTYLLTDIVDSVNKSLGGQIEAIFATLTTD